MPRYILIERNTGYIWGDSADFASGQQSDLTPIEAARLLDESLHEHGRTYEEANRSDQDVTYDVYQADIRSSEAVPVVQDGQDQEVIDAVERDCDYVTSIRRTRDEEAA